MKSNQEQLKNRGYVEPGAELEYKDINPEKKLEMLKSPVPYERTLSARLLISPGNIEIQKIIGNLINALSVEKKLYPKIEICNTLVLYGEHSVKQLTEVLGKIGSNQYKSIPEDEFRKKNYPLARDIASRTLANIGTVALPELIKILSTDNKKQLSEALDAIGYICFYNDNPEYYENLRECYENNSTNDLICWKIIRVMSAFPESKDFLLEQLQNRKNSERMKKEAERSLRLISKKNQI